jgi:hypothetical protein
MDFDEAITEHLELRRRNARLEPGLPLERYSQARSRDDLPFNQQAEALPEGTRDVSPGSPASASAEADRETDSSRLWDIPPLFDWGE